jgi:hypothetical protein
LGALEATKTTHQITELPSALLTHSTATSLQATGEMISQVIIINLLFLNHGILGESNKN